jgi:hypothetical protein
MQRDLGCEIHARYCEIGRKHREKREDPAFEIQRDSYEIEGNRGTCRDIRRSSRGLECKSHVTYKEIGSRYRKIQDDRRSREDRRARPIEGRDLGWEIERRYA